MGFEGLYFPLEAHHVDVKLVYSSYWLALGVVVADLVQEQFLDGVELLGPLEEDGGDADVPAQGQAHGRAQHGGQLEQPVECHLNEEEEEGAEEIHKLGLH